MKTTFTTLWALCVLLLLSLSAPAHAVETTIYFHYDALGSPVAATNAAGTVLWREAYRPYGDRLRKQDGGANTQWYTGKQYDAESGLSYFGARYYDPRIGRFMGTDSAGFTDGNFQNFNRYAYANNNPYAYVDPDGNSVIDIAFLVVDRIKLAQAIQSSIDIGEYCDDIWNVPPVSITLD